MQNNIEPKKGTTTVGIICDEGVVLAADKRASMGYLIAHKNVKKIHQLIDDIAITIAGGVGDAQMLIRYVKAEAKLFEFKNQRKTSVKALSTLLSHILYSGKNQIYPYYVQFLLGGKDKKGFSLSVLGPDGAKLEDAFISTGSGSVFAYGMLQEHYKKDMNLSEAIKLAVKSVNVAIERDMATGDGIDVVIINNDGLKELSKTEIGNYLKTVI
ncbi:MAG: archaeal proteasome endopeptidase complex subunit beta [Nanoarchaeota archaeon]|nr:archaeal proteasome endopeptidase complex subunit beta [Nanoarchaeota archaeon]